MPANTVHWDILPDRGDSRHNIASSLHSVSMIQLLDRSHSLVHVPLLHLNINRKLFFFWCLNRAIISFNVDLASSLPQLLSNILSCCQYSDTCCLRTNRR